MGFSITDVRFNNELRPAQDLKYLAGVVGEKVTVEVDLIFEDIVFVEPENIIEFDPSNATLDVANNVGILKVENGFSFTAYQVGDTVKVWDEDSSVLSTFTVLEKIDNGTIRTDRGAGNLSLIVGSYVYLATPYAGLRFNYNLSNVAGDFFSFIDGELQQAQMDALDATNLSNQPLSFTGIKSYQIGSVQVKGGGTFGLNGAAGDIQQLFTITHETYITPFFLLAQYNDLLLGKAPAYFQAGENLNYIAKLGVGRDLNDPNGLVELSVPTNESSTVWFNKKVGNEQTNYAITSLVLERVSDAATIPQLEFEDVQATITIENTVDAPFIDTATKFTFGFNYLPDDEDNYQENGEDQVRNFLLDTKTVTLGTGSVNGDNFGVPLQVIKTVDSTFNSSSSIDIVVNIEPLVDATAILEQTDTSRYQFWVIIEDHSLAADKIDKVNLLAQVNQFDKQLTTTNLIQSSNSTFIAHPYVDAIPSVAGASLDTFPVDDVVANLDFNIDFTTHTAAELITIKTIRSRMLLKKTGQADILLEDFSFGTSAFPIVGGEAQNINFLQDRVFKIPAGEIRKQITAIRDFGSDVASNRFYTYQYPFMKRWEYWEALGLSAPPSDLFDNTLENDGINHFWHRYTTIAGWTMNYEVEFTIEQNGVEFEQTFNTVIQDSLDFEGNADWGNHTIDSFEIPSGTPLVNGGLKLVKGYQDVKIVAQAERVSGPVPLLVNMGAVIWIETFEAGGISDIRRMSSFFVKSDNSWFKSTDTSDKVVMASPSAGVFTAECILDSSKIPTNAKFTIYARFYEFVPPFGKQFQDLTSFQFQDSIIYDFQ